MEKTSIVARMGAVIQALRAPKDKRNAFGKYSYRNAEDILEALKPLLVSNGLLLTISDEVKEVAGRVYVESEAIVTDGEQHIASRGYAREGEQRAGMDVAQITGACSSYARKYALCGLFCISGGADFDSMDNTTQGIENVSRETSKTEPTPSSGDVYVDMIESAKTIEQLGAVWAKLPEERQLQYKGLFSQKKKNLIRK